MEKHGVRYDAVQAHLSCPGRWRITSMYILENKVWKRGNEGCGPTPPVSRKKHPPPPNQFFFQKLAYVSWNLKCGYPEVRWYSIQKKRYYTCFVSNALVRQLIGLVVLWPLFLLPRTILPRTNIFPQVWEEKNLTPNNWIHKCPLFAIWQHAEFVIDKAEKEQENLDGRRGPSGSKNVIIHTKNLLRKGVASLKENCIRTPKLQGTTFKARHMRSTKFINVGSARTNSTSQVQTALCRLLDGTRESRDKYARKEIGVNQVGLVEACHWL